MSLSCWLANSWRRENDADPTVEHYCTASIGIALFIQHEASQDDILKWADKAMYQAKAAGRNQIKFYDERDDRGYLPLRS